MPESKEAEWLRVHWSMEHLGSYNKKWIAVNGNEVIAADEKLEVVMKSGKVSEMIYQKERPLYAFVYFGELQ